jgi:hypothetical protein
MTLHLGGHKVITRAAIVCHVRRERHKIVAKFRQDVRFARSLESVRSGQCRSAAVNKRSCRSSKHAYQRLSRY